MRVVQLALPRGAGGVGGPAAPAGNSCSSSLTIRTVPPRPARAVAGGHELRNQHLVPGQQLEPAEELPPAVPASHSAAEADLEVRRRHGAGVRAGGRAHERLLRPSPSARRPQAVPLKRFAFGASMAPPPPPVDARPVAGVARVAAAVRCRRCRLTTRSRRSVPAAAGGVSPLTPAARQTAVGPPRLLLLAWRPGRSWAAPTPRSQRGDG